MIALDSTFVSRLSSPRANALRTCSTFSISTSLLILTYTALCIAIFKVFNIPLNKWTVPTAVLGGVVLVGTLVLLMNYNHPFTQLGNQVFPTTPIVSGVRGRVVEVPVQANQPLKTGDILFKIDPVPFEAEVARLEAKVPLSIHFLQKMSITKRIF